MANDQPPSTWAFRRRAASVQLLRKPSGLIDNHLLRSDHPHHKHHHSASSQSQHQHPHPSQQRSKRFQRWMACFAFVTKLKPAPSKSRMNLDEDHAEAKRGSSSYSSVATQMRRHSSIVVSQRDPRPSMCAIFDPRPFYDQATNDSIASSLHHPDTPSSALSPPPRHAMVKKERAQSMTPETLPRDKSHQDMMHTPVPRRCITPTTRKLALRLSLDVDQHCPAMVPAASISSNSDESDTGSQHGADDFDQTASSVTIASSSSTSAQNNQQQQQQQQQQHPVMRPVVHADSMKRARPLSLAMPNIQLARSSHLDETESAYVDAPPSPLLSSLQPSSSSDKPLSLKERRRCHRPHSLPQLEKLSTTPSATAADTSSSRRSSRRSSMKSAAQDSYEENMHHEEHDNGHTNMDDEEDNNYEQWIDEFRLPATLTGLSPATAAATASPSVNISEVASEKNQESSEKETRHFSHPLWLCQPKTSCSEKVLPSFHNNKMRSLSVQAPISSRSMDIVRDKLSYDAVVARTLQKRPSWARAREEEIAKEGRDRFCGERHACQESQELPSHYYHPNNHHHYYHHSRLVAQDGSPSSGDFSPLKRSSRESVTPSSECVQYFPPSPNSLG